MSQDRLLTEAKRWIVTAGEDLEAARVLQAGEKYSHACFFSQQSAEKALKALWYLLDGDPWGHSVQKLIEETPDSQAQRFMTKVFDDGVYLDRYYIPTRYPNGLPDLTPGKCYFTKDAVGCLKAAENIIQRVQAWFDKHKGGSQ